MQRNKKHEYLVKFTGEITIYAESAEEANDFFCEADFGDVESSDVEMVDIEGR